MARVGAALLCIAATCSAFVTIGDLPTAAAVPLGSPLTNPGQVRAPLLASQQAQLLAPDAGAEDWLGTSVAISGDTALVGVRLDDLGAVMDAGSAVVFARAGRTWALQAVLVAPDAALNDGFGRAVVVEGDTALVAAPFDDVGAVTDAGSVYVFVRTGGAWTLQTKLTASDRANDDRFGFSVALCGETALVAAVGDDLGALNEAGSAYIFTRSGSTWTQRAKLLSSDPRAEDCFGYAVALSTDTALVGAPFHNPGAVGHAGSAYVFTGSGATWVLRQMLSADELHVDDFVGCSVALSGDTAL